MSGLQPSVLANKLGLSVKTLRLVFAKICVLENGCWKWFGGKRHGYGAIQIRYLPNKSHQAHRLFYQLAHGYLDFAVPLHHKVENGCIGPVCCNPDHLMETTTGVHTRDLTPGSASYIASHRDCCAAGHPYTIESLRFTRGLRQCRICDKIKAQARRDTVRALPRPVRDHAKVKDRCFRGHILEGDNIRIVQFANGPRRVCLHCEEMRNGIYHGRCKRGQLKQGDNVYLRSDGRHECLACRKLHFYKNGDEKDPTVSDIPVADEFMYDPAKHGRLMF